MANVDSDGRDRRSVSGTITERCPDVPDHIRNAMKSDDWRVRGSTVMDLPDLGPAAISILVDAALHDRNEYVRGIASDAIGRCKDLSALPLLVIGLMSEDHRVAADAGGTIISMFWHTEGRVRLERFGAALESAFEGRKLDPKASRFLERMMAMLAKRMSVVGNLREHCISGMMLTDRPRPPQKTSAPGKARQHSR
ncbi:MAG: HEAT repeat domain-containing protein [Candidatus Micrarchaeota archaeon]